ncbi:Phage-associated protein [Streptococcus oralis]|uniref:Phage-associated protein n=1 Tax=Streptococcus oralis TaxID=1303 RepID=A0A139RIM3_STROR|nr:phage tail protein [Streptococcus oralis]KXU14617.1 Phage-associated protein [Streptococcus oralis]
MFYMIINGFNTSTIPHCVVTDFGEIEAAKPHAESVDVYGLNGSYRVLDGSYESYERTISFYVPKLVDVSTIVDKFQLKENVIEFSYQPESYFYADFSGATYNRNGMHAWKIDVKLIMQPFRYQKDVAPVVLTASGTVNNPGTIYSEPIIELEGDGDISLTIGRKTMYLTIKTKATIDCRQGKQNIYNATGAVQNTLRKRGGFLEIPTGKVGFSFTGNVRKITIRPNWRYKV